MLVLAAVSDLQFQKTAQRGPRRSFTPGGARRRRGMPPSENDPRPPRGDRPFVDPNARRGPGPGGRAAPCAVPVRSPLILYTPCDDCPSLAPVLLAMGEMRHHSGRVESHRRPPGSLARPPVRRGDAVRLAAVYSTSSRTRAPRPLPAELRWVLEDAMAQPPALCRRSSRSPRAARVGPAAPCARWFGARPPDLPRPAGISSPAAPRPLRATACSRNPGFTIEDVAQNGSATPRRRRSSSTRAQVSRPHGRRNAPVADGGRGDPPASVQGFLTPRAFARRRNVS